MKDLLSTTTSITTTTTATTTTATITITDSCHLLSSITSTSHQFNLYHSLKMKTPSIYQFLISQNFILPFNMTHDETLSNCICLIV